MRASTRVGYHDLTRRAVDELDGRLRARPVEPPVAPLEQRDDDGVQPQSLLGEAVVARFRIEAPGYGRVMTNPQQPELRRSGRGATDEDSAKSKASSNLPPDDGDVAPVPPDNQPGHHPDQEQDKPT